MTVPLQLFNNFASTTLASGALSTDPTLALAVSTGALFPSPGSGQIATVVVEDTNGNIEIMLCTGRSGDILSVTRGAEGTTPLAFASGSRVEQRITAGIIGVMLQKEGSDVLSGTTTFSGVLSMGSSGSIQGGEYAGGYIRGAPGQTSNQIQVPSSGPPTASGSVILTAANAAGNVPAGYDFMHTNMVCYWYGSSGAIPSGWQLCNGTNGTPDLRDQFILGGGGVLPTSGGSSSTTTGSTDPSGSLAIAGTALTAGDLPTLTYQLWGSSGQAQQASNWTLGSSSAQVAGYQVLGGSFISVNGGNQQLVNTPNTGGAGGGAASPHTHGLSGSLNHAHSYTLPPYIALFAIMKL